MLKLDDIIRKFEQDWLNFGWAQAHQALPNYIADHLAKTSDVFIPPCKPGDMVFRINKQGNYQSNWKPFVEPIQVSELNWKMSSRSSGKDLGWRIIANGASYKVSSIGKTLFLEPNEALAALNKLVAKKHNG